MKVIDFYELSDVKVTEFFNFLKSEPNGLKNLSNEMIEDNQAEEYPDIAFHFPLFAINQLLNKAYNGKFPNAKATKSCPSSIPALKLTKLMIFPVKSKFNSESPLAKPKP